MGLGLTGKLGLAWVGAWHGGGGCDVDDVVGVVMWWVMFHPHHTASHIINTMHPCTMPCPMPCTDPCMVQLAHQPQPHFNPT